MAHLTANATLTGSQLRGKCVAIIIIIMINNIILHVQKDDCALRMDDVVRQTNTAICKLLQWSSFQGHLLGASTIMHVILYESDSTTKSTL